MPQSANLLTTSSLVEAPFIVVQIGDYRFGCYKNSLKNGQTIANINAPNYVQSIYIKKINGAVNQYTVNMEYGITQFTDPNYIEKVLSSVSGTRKITFSYGDCNEPSFIYKNEEAIITGVTNGISYSSSKITYTIKAISSSALTLGIIKSWPKTNAKPSDVIKRMIVQNQYGLRDVFTGMQDWSKVVSENLLPADDKKIDIEGKQGMSAFDYLNYLVQCMESVSDPSAIYTLSVYDTNDAPLYGTYFKISKVSKRQAKSHNANAFEVNIGYPSDPMVVDFQTNTNEQWSILYEYACKNIVANRSYSIDNNGNIITENSNSFIKNNYKGSDEPETKSWWKKVTEFPIQGTLTIKGLLRPASLMQYVKINAYFYGQKFITSGIYIITEQNDSIDQNGYRTTLNLLRIGGDEDDN